VEPVPVEPAGSPEPSTSGLEGVSATLQVSLPNGRVGAPYSATIDGTTIDGATDGALAMTDDDGTGLHFEAATGVIGGVPTRSGDACLVFTLQTGDRFLRIVADLVIIPDTRSLWVSVPSARSTMFWKPDHDVDESAGVGVRCLGGSRRGRSHARAGSCRDDDFAIASDPTGWQILAVADGAGSARYSRRGSMLAVSTVRTMLPELLDEFLTDDLDSLLEARRARHPDVDSEIKRRLYQTLATAAFAAAREIEHDARDRGFPAEDLSTTLLIAVARRSGHGWFIAGFSVGDGGGVVLDLDDRSVTPLARPDSGEFAGQTLFLQRSQFAGGFTEVADRLFFTVRDRFTAVILMTDGITDPVFPSEAQLMDPTCWAAFWADLTAAVDLAPGNSRRYEQLASWLDFFSPGEHDDRTIALIVPEQPEDL
ncbi:MAG TPA: PP2C family serine/threonine-protein phosphatase, partial [Nakamurella multipartita]|nr:PP2C family serine/threonine-protein phosphatase [Nakamurella multipartita]